MMMSNGTPCSTQLIFCETQKEKLEVRIEKLEAALIEARDGVVKWLADNEEKIARLERDVEYWRDTVRKELIEDYEKQLAALKQQGEPVFIVFDGSPGPDSPRFIEVETADGKSTFVDGWHEYPEDIAMHLGMWRLGPLYTSAPSPSSLPALPEGYVLVPIEPLRYVYRAATEVRCNNLTDLLVIKEVLSAAPKQGEKA